MATLKLRGGIWDGRELSWPDGVLVPTTLVCHRGKADRRIVPWPQVVRAPEGADEWLTYVGPGAWLETAAEFPPAGAVVEYALVTPEQPTPAIVGALEETEGERGAAPPAGEDGPPAGEDGALEPARDAEAGHVIGGTAVQE